MPIELEPFRLPIKWASSGIDDRNTPRLFIKNTFPSVGELPINGGWGYTREDCVIIDKNDPIVPTGLPFNGVGIEYAFVEKRIYAELIIFRHPDEAFSGIKWDLKQQRLISDSDRHFDMLVFRVSAMTDQDWEYLKNDWENSGAYSGDEKGHEKHELERQARTRFYDTEFWFDITSFHG